MKLKHTLKIILYAILLLLFIGFLCYADISPLDAITGATSTADGLQKGGALTYFLEDTGR